MTNQRFTIDTEYLTCVTVKYGYTDDMGMECSTTSSVDHPAFTGLREHLGARGFIRIERGWWNGDRVIKPFYFNGLLLNVGDKFLCAGAWKYRKFDDKFVLDR